MKDISGKIKTDSLTEVYKLDGDLVKKAACKLKPGKSDVSETFVSDCILNAPDELFDILSAIFRSWMIHGTVTLSLLACAFLPLLKGSKDTAKTSNYRTIAGSSLLLKLFEQCVLLL